MVITPLTPKGLDTLVSSALPNQQQNVELEKQNRGRPDLPTTASSRSTTRTPPGIVLARAWKRSSRSAPRKLLSSRVTTISVHGRRRAIDIMRGAGIDKIGLITAKLEADQ